MDRTTRQTRDSALLISQNEEPDYIIRGTAVVFNTPTLYRGEWEMVAPTAVDNALVRGDDVVLLQNHDPNYTACRISAGNLRLWKDDIGLQFEGQLDPEITWEKDLWKLVQKRVINKCSFGFHIDSESTKEIDGKLVYVIKDITLYDVSVVTFPAYSDTSAEARSADDEQRRENPVYDSDYLRVEFDLL